MPRPRSWRPDLATSCLVLMVLLIVIGGLIFWRPFLTRSSQQVTEVPAPPALFVLAEFPVAPNQQACENSVTVTSDTRFATFQLRPAKPSREGGPPVGFVLSGQGYRATAVVPGGYPGGSVTLRITPPRHTLIGTACFVNLGTKPVLLDGTTEGRTIARPALEIAGRPVTGDVALSFQGLRSESLPEELGVLFDHASNLTDGLVPVWLIWLIAPLVAFGVPIALILAYYSAMLEDFGDAR